MSENNTNGGLLSSQQTTQNSYADPFKQAAKPSEPSTSKSKGAQGQRPNRNKPRSQQDRIEAVNNLLAGKSPHVGEDTQLGDQITSQGKRDTTDGDIGPSSGGPAGDASADVDSAVSGGAESLPGVSGDLSVKELAETLGTTPKKLYESLQITTGDGETLTLGEVKDRITTQEAATRESVERETAISQRESAMLQNMQLLDSVMHDLKGKLSPEIVQKLQRQTAEREARERGMMLKAMPELADKAQLDTFRTDVAETMQAYGFRPNELVIRDHRIALAIKDLIQTKRQLQKLMEFQPEQTPPKTRKPQGKQRRPNRSAETIAKGRSSNRPQDKAVAVNAILQEAKR